MAEEESTGKLQQQYRICVTALLLCVPVALVWAILYPLRAVPNYADIAIEMLTALLVLIVFSKVWGLGIRPLQVGGVLFLLGIYMDALHDIFLAPEYIDVFLCQFLQLAGVTLFLWSTYYHHSQLKQNVAWLRKDLREMEHQATHDPLTELPNRLLFHDRLLQALANARRYQRQLAVLYIDLDDMKRVNDTFGHGTGDELLKTIAGRLQASIRNGDTIARLSGDEFAVIQTDVTQPEDAQNLANKLLQTINEPFDCQGESIQPDASIGISLYPVHTTAAHDLLKQADSAMYQAKQSGTGPNIAIYDGSTA